MTHLVVQTLITAAAIWLTTLIIPGMHVESMPGSQPVALITTYLVAALAIAVVNLVVGIPLKVLSLPLYILTLGLWSFIINAVLLWIVGAISGAIGWGLMVERFWWSAVLGAIVLGIAEWLVGAVARGLGVDAG
ncbi:phage holin family protein [Pseudoclavibacter caeni]|jgi:putative membrane protein|nr:phage holin family protein [Pseudoclavibacter caeni]NYJ97422.1 putative membrane protein [Pseudoclavibacter caeni]